MVFLTGLGIFVQFRIYIKEKKREAQKGNEEENNEKKGIFDRVVNVLKGKKKKNDEDEDDDDGINIDEEGNPQLNIFKKKNFFKKNNKK